MQYENSALFVTSSNSEDELTELKPSAKLLMSMEPQGGTRSISIGSNKSNNSGSSSDTRASRFNDRLVCGSPMLSARDCFMRSSEDTDSQDAMASTRDNLEGRFELSFDSSNTSEEINNIKETGIKRFQQKAEHRIETTEEIFERRINRINQSFFRENPSQKVPRFVANELSLGNQLGEGEFGSVYEIETLERQPPPSLDFKAILENAGGSQAFTNASEESGGSTSGAPLGSTLTLPIATDLMVGPGNLDDFLRRRLEAFEEHPVTPSTMEIYKVTTQTKQNNHRIDDDIETPFHKPCNDDNVHNGHTNRQSANHFNADSDEESIEMHAARRRPGLKSVDHKGQMINRHNNADDLDNFDGYVVKVVRDDICNESKKRVAAADIAAEAKLLSALSHRNIIRIRGIMGYIERPRNYGIIMDKLRSTLQEQIHEWAKVTLEDNIPRAAPENEKHPILDHTPQWMLRQEEKDKQTKLFQQTEFFVERMVAVSDVSQAMKYLHEKRIIFRDLKPENVGLTKDNYVLFDFGLSRELNKTDRVGDAEDEYHATFLTGSRLFMAPEVATKKPYGFSADVYSFAILFWEVMSLKEVFPTMTLNKHYKLVILKGRRPQSLIDILPPELNEMMEASWDKNPSNRPTFESIGEILTLELEKLENNKKNNSSSSTFLSFGGLTGWNGSWKSGEENKDRNSYEYLSNQSGSKKSLREKLHLEHLEEALEKVQESVTGKILKISHKSSRPSSSA